MSSGRKKRRMNLNADRLSNLPDDILHKILSCVGTKAVVRTSSLSSRWRFLWTSMPYLFFTSRAFPSMRKFYQSVINVLSNRNNEIQVFSLSLCVYGSPSDAFFDLVLDYAFSHNVQELTIKCKKKFHFFDFSSESLKVLTLDGIEFDCDDICTSNWELPALTTLHLIGVTLLDDQDFDIGECNDVNECWDEFFSKCPNLKTLTFDCSNGGGEFHICHPTLSNLELANVYGDYTTFSVDTPQLKYLSIINCVFVHLLSTPELTSLIYKHPNTFEFDADCLSSLEKVDFCICNPDEDNIFMKGVVDVLQKFQSVKFLTINVEFLELLYWESDSNEPSPLANLKSLKIYPAIIDEVEEYDEIEEYDFQKYDEDDEYDFEYELKYEDDHEEEEEDENKEEYEGVEEDADKEEDGDEEDEDEDEDEEEDEEEDDAVNIGAEVKNFFLNSSPSATVTNVTCQEIKAVTTPELVINLMKELQVLLKEEKAKIFMARKKQGKTPMQSHVTELHQQGKTEVMKKMQLLAEERVLSTESRWKDPTVQYYLENGKIGHMVSKLQAIEGILATFPNSKRGQMKACFRRLLAEANLVMKKLDDATSRNIGEGRVEEQLPQNQKECDTTPGRWGNWYKRRSKQQGPGRWGNWYKRRSKQQGPGRWGNWYERRSKQQGPGRWGNWYRRRSKQQGSGRWGKWYKRHPNNKDHSALAHKG